MVGPVRTCVGCRERHDVDQLMRIGCDDDGQLIVDRKVPGRSVWLCRQAPECVSRAMRSQALARGLRRTVSPEAVAGFMAVFGQQQAE